MKGTLYSISKQVTIYLSDELLNKISSIETNNTSLNKKILQLIESGITKQEEQNPKYVVDNAFHYLRELVMLRDNKEIRITLNKG